MSTVVPANLSYVSTLEKLSENPLTVGTAIAECLQVIRAYEISAAKVSYVANVAIQCGGVFKIDILPGEKALNVHYNAADYRGRTEEKTEHVSARKNFPLTPDVLESYVANKAMYDKLMASKRLVDLLSGKI